MGGKSGVNVSGKATRGLPPMSFFIDEKPKKNSRPLTILQGVCFSESILSNVLKSSIFITFAQNMVYLAKNTHPFVIITKYCHFCYENI